MSKGDYNPGEKLDAAMAEGERKARMTYLVCGAVVAALIAIGVLS